MKTPKLKHFNQRPENSLIDTIVIHSMHASKNELDPQTNIEELDRHNVSAHYLISQEGEVMQLVDESMRAWHAGKSQMPDGRNEVNDFSIGIELIANQKSGFSEAQYKALAKLTEDIASRHPIKHILGHDCIATPAGRKTDPGESFDWKKLERLVSLKLQFPSNRTI